MEKQNLVISNHNAIEYEICSYLMRKEILCAYIQTPNEKIMYRLGDYMSQCGIPWEYCDTEIFPEKGYVLGCTAMTVPHDFDSYICISLNGDTPNRGDNMSLLLNLEGEVNAPDDEEFIDLDSVPMHLQNGEIRKMFLYAFKIAESEIDIISPWMNRGVINDNFLMLMERALSKGVHIKIIYGLKPDSGEYNLSRSRKSDEMAELMRTRFADKSDLLTIKRDNIHYKLVLCDEKYKLEGGFNYLSFRGIYDDPDTRKEGSPFGRSIEEIKYLRKKYFEG